MKSTSITAIAALISHTFAHGIVTKIVAGTKTYQGYDPNFQYMPTPPAVIGWTAPLTQDRGPVPGTSLNNPDIICQRGATNAQMSAPIAAGDSVSLQWTPWPASHHGPMLNYLADCGGDCKTVDKSTLKFFKIDGVGMTSAAGTPSVYADDQMITNNNTWTVKIPSNIKAGNYVLRHETIALHQAQSAGGSQPYPQCVNLMVTGGGTDTPVGVLGTELYKETDPGIMFNIYQQFTSTSDYPVPGPALYSGASNPAAPVGTSAPAPSAPVVTSAPVATTAPAISTTVSTSTKAASPCKAKRASVHPRDFSV